jgi:DNA (cytosine-5)-methyltransferase 1
MKAAELFAGVGGFRLGMERNGIKTIYANEWDKYAAQTYQKHFGEIDTRDLTTVDARDIPAHDILCGGFPCQAFSVAGKRRGFDETRGTLFFEICRIARHHRTPYLFLENVKGLLNHDRGATFFTILGSLDELGYDVQWQVLNSKDFGVPQNRERVFIVANLRDKPRPQVFPIGGADEENPSDSVPEGSEAGATLIDVSYPGRKRAYKRTAPTVRDYGSGGNKMPMVQRQPLRFLDRNQKNIKGDYAFTVDTSGDTGGLRIRSATKAGFEEAQAGDSVNLAVPNSKTRRGRVGKGVAQTVDTGAQQAVVTDRIRRLTPMECERLQGFPDNWTGGVSETQRYKQMGNAVTVNVIEAVSRKIAEVA